MFRASARRCCAALGGANLAHHGAFAGCVPRRLRQRWRMKVREVIRLLQQHDWRHVRTISGHRRIQNPERPATVADA